MIKPSKRGTFKAQATKMGMGVQEAASKILSAEEDRYSPEMRKKANFAKNFARNGGLINPNTGRLKLEDGIPTWEELQLQGFISSSNPPPGEGWKQYTTTVKGAPSNAKIWYREKASDANDAFVYAKKQGVNKGDTFEYKGKKYVYKFAETPKELKALEEATKKEFAYNYEQNPDTINDIEDIMPGEFPQESVQEPLTYNTPQVDPLKPDWLGVGASAIPGLISGIGNLALANQVDYGRISPNQIRLQHLDPTRNIQNQITAANTAREGFRQNTSGSRYAAGVLASQTLQAEGVANVLHNYDDKNTIIDNTERELNFRAKKEASYANADIQRKELQDRLGFKAAGIEGIGNAATASLDYYRGDKRFRDYQQLLQPDYLLANVEGETRAVPRSWLNNQMMNNNQMESQPTENNGLFKGMFNRNKNRYKINPNQLGYPEMELNPVLDEFVPSGIQYNQAIARYGGRLKRRFV